MALHAKRRRDTIEIILDQQTAQEIKDLGDKLTASLSGVRTEGGNPIAEDYARRIEQLREESEDDTVVLTVEALPYSTWSQIITRNTKVENGVAKRDIVDTVRQSLKAMIVEAKPESATIMEILDVIPELTDGQLTPVWQTILDLNGSLVDPKAAIESASRILRGASRS